MAERILMNEYKSLSKEPWTNIELINENIFEWSVALIVTNSESYYYGGYFKATMTFPKNYPYAPPDFRFLRPLYHPNIYPDGRLCISILHAPGDDEMSGESAAERWNPAQRVESVLISIISLLDDAEVSSPANVDAGVKLRTKPEEYKALVNKDLEASKQDIPDDFTMPTSESWKKRDDDKDARFQVDDWADSDDEGDFDFDSDDNAGDADFDEDMDDDSCSAEDEEDDGGEDGEEAKEDGKRA